MEKTIQEMLDQAWQRKVNTVNWLGLEHCQRTILRAYKRKELDAWQAMEKMDEALAAYTGRGNELEAA